MTAHQSVITRLDDARGMFTCSHNTGDRDLVEIWNGSGSQVSSMVFGTPTDVFERIVGHVTTGDNTASIAEAVQAARVLVGLANDVQPGVELLAESLTALSLTVMP